MIIGALVCSEYLTRICYPSRLGKVLAVSGTSVSCKQALFLVANIKLEINCLQVNAVIILVAKKAALGSSESAWLSHAAGSPQASKSTPGST